MNQTVVTHLENTIRGHPQDWDLWLDNVLLGIRISPSQSRGVSPYEVLFGVPPNIPLSFRFKDPQDVPFKHFDPDVIARSLVSLSDVRLKQWRSLQDKLQQDRENQFRRNHPFSVGQEVLVRNFKRQKTEARWLGPFFVEELHAKGVSVRRENGQVVPYNLSDIKRFLPQLSPVQADPVASAGGETVARGAPAPTATDLLH